MKACTCQETQFYFSSTAIFNLQLKKGGLLHKFMFVRIQFIFFYQGNFSTHSVQTWQSFPQVSSGWRGGPSWNIQTGEGWDYGNEWN
jgi:hypothetical protein